MKGKVLKSKAWATVLAAVMLVSGLGLAALLAGCSKSVNYNPDNFIDVGDPEYDSGKIVKEKVTIKMFAPKHAIQPEWEDMAIFQWMEEKTNIHVEFEEVLLESYQEKRGLKWEEKDPSKMTDAFYLCNNPDEITALVGAGALTALNDDEGSDEFSGNYGNLIENYAPNLSAWMDKYPDIAANSTQNDGKIYSFSAINTQAGGFGKQYINEKWLKKTDWYAANSRLPETVEELEIVFTEFKNKDMNGNGDPYDEIPFSYYPSDQSRFFMTAAFGFVGAGIEEDTREEIWNGSAWVPNPNKGKIVWVPATDEYREYVKTMRRWYENGLIDERIYENNEGTLAKKGNDNRLGCFSTAGAFLVVGDELDADYTTIGPLTSKYNNQKMWYQYRRMYDPTLLIIPKTSPYKREITRWMDVLYDESTVSRQSYGEEGVNWQWDTRTDGTKCDGTKEGDTWTFNIPEGMQREQYRATLSCGPGTDGVVLATEFATMESDPRVQKVNREVQKYLPFLKVYIPPLIYTSEQMEKISNIESSLNTIMTQSEAYFVTDVTNQKKDYNPANDDHWNKFVTKMKNAGNISVRGYEMLVEQYQAALDSYNARQK